MARAEQLHRLRAVPCHRHDHALARERLAEADHRIGVGPGDEDVRPAPGVLTERDQDGAGIERACDGLHRAQG